MLKSLLSGLKRTWSLEFAKITTDQRHREIEEESSCQPIIILMQTITVSLEPLLPSKWSVVSTVKICALMEISEVLHSLWIKYRASCITEYRKMEEMCLTPASITTTKIETWINRLKMSTSSMSHVKVKNMDKIWPLSQYKQLGSIDRMRLNGSIITKTQNY